MYKYFPPSGSPIKTKEILYWLACNAFFADKRKDINNQLRDRLKVDHSYLFTTGRGAMTVLLRSLKKLRNKAEINEVIIPAYTCYSVASSIQNAGLKVRLCDVDPITLSYNLEKLQKIPFANVLCIISANLYGIPNQLQEIESIANKNGVYMVDDAAQSFNAKYQEREVGTFGTAGLYSFDKGKNITSIEGGGIITNNSELAELLDSYYSKMPSNSVKDNLLTAIKVIIYYLFLNPLLYWIPASLPFLNLGKTRYEENIEIKKYSRLVAPIALMQIKRSDQIAEKRIANGLWYKSNIKEKKTISKINESDQGKPVYLRYPIKVKQREKREAILTHAKRYGITKSYPKSLNQLKEIEKILVNPGEFEGAEQISAQLITLPTHTFINNNDRENIKNIIDEMTA
ncbi:MAG: DegT/DnrJ/EryC1/StrS family aminotransferase [Candidatus Thiodiazotropha endolucinida]